MSNQDAIFHVDSVSVAGKPIPFQDGSATLDGVARYENKPVPAGSGRDGTIRSRIPTTVKMKLLFNSAQNPADFIGMTNVQITLRDLEAPRRALCNSCSFATMGEIGSGPVDIVFNVLEPVQWL